MKPVTYFCELYQSHFFFCFGWKESDFEKMILKKFDVEIEVKNDAGTTTEISGTGVFVWTAAKDVSVLAHECVHAANLTLARVGVEPSHGNDEAQAYLVESLMRNALRGGKK